MVTMAKKAKKVRSEVVVSPEHISAAAGDCPDSEEETVTLPVKLKKKNKKKNKDSAASPSEVRKKELATINEPSEVVKEAVEEKSNTKSCKERMKVND